MKRKMEGTRECLVYFIIYEKMLAGYVSLLFVGSELKLLMSHIILVFASSVWLTKHCSKLTLRMLVSFILIPTISNSPFHINIVQITLNKLSSYTLV